MKDGHSCINNTKKKKKKKFYFAEQIKITKQSTIKIQRSESPGFIGKQILNRCYISVKTAVDRCWNN